jgi:hypothetical protein
MTWCVGTPGGKRTCRYCRYFHYYVDGRGMVCSVNKEVLKEEKLANFLDKIQRVHNLDAKCSRWQKK